MASVIDPTKPEDGVPANKAELRANLEAAKAELDHGGFAEGFTPAQYGPPASARVRDHLAAIDAALGGLGSFTGLADTPSVYATHGSRFVKVKADETGLEFANPPGGSGGLTGYTDVKADHIGATGDGTTDDTAALQAALNSGAAVVYLPPGTYRITSSLTITPGTTVIGAGPGQTIIDATGLPSQHDPAALFCQGTTITLPSLAATVAEGDHTITFSSSVAADVRENDAIGIADTRDSSFMATGATHRAGAWLTVMAVNGSTVVPAGGVARTLPSTRIAGGTTGDLDIVRIDRRGVTLCNFTLDCSGLDSWPDGTSPNGIGITLRYLADPVVENVHVRSARTNGLEIDRCVRARIRGCLLTALNSGWVNADAIYGVAIKGSAFSSITDCYISGARHGVDYGGGGAESPLRWTCSHDNVVSHSVIECTGNNDFVNPGSTYTIAMNWHESTYRCHVQDCMIRGGIGPRSFGHRIVGNHIFAGKHKQNVPAVNLDNMGPRFDITFTNNQIRSFTANICMRVRWDNIENVEDPGMFDVSNNVFEIRASTGSPIIEFQNGPPAGAAHVKIHDNVVLTDNNQPFVSISSDDGDFVRVSILDNQLPSNVNVGTVANAASYVARNMIGDYIEFAGLPTTNPGGSGRLWADAGTLKIT